MILVYECPFSSFHDYYIGLDLILIDVSNNYQSYIFVITQHKVLPLNDQFSLLLNVYFKLSHVFSNTSDIFRSRRSSEFSN